METLDLDLANALQDLNKIKEYYEETTNIQPESYKKADTAVVTKQNESEKLNVAESVIRKLYKRNLELEAKLKHVKVQSNQDDDIKEDYDPVSTKLTSEQHLLRMLETREKTILELQSTVDSLQLKFNGDTTVSNQQSFREQKKRMRVKRESEVLIKELTMKCEYHTQQCELLRHAHKQRKGESKRLSNTLFESQKAFHENELIFFNSRLSELENENSELYAEIGMLETKLGRLNDETKEREVIDKKIQDQVYGLFQHVKTLEAENKRLKL